VVKQRAKKEAPPIGDSIPRPALATCVLVGNLNPAIIEPGWLMRQRILAASEEIQLRLGMPGSVTPIQFRSSQYAWSISSQVLSVSALSDKADPGAFVASIMEKLFHTPVQAVGNNFHFPVGEIRSTSIQRLLGCQSPDFAGREFLGYSVALKLSYSDALLTLTLSEEDHKLKLADFNFHRDCGDSSSAVDAAKCWQTDKQEALRITRGILRK
jgi:hypothetical protein